MGKAPVTQWDFSPVGQSGALMVVMRNHPILVLGHSTHLRPNPMSGHSNHAVEIEHARFITKNQFQGAFVKALPI